MDILLYLIVGGVQGVFAGFFLGKGTPGGIFVNVVAGFVGAWLGTMLFEAWIPEIGGFFIAPALIGALVMILIVFLIMKAMRK
jgi:uncharacterized membrane protein YeaQ/YmgE (transglycosylase-associated protein family)